MDIRYDRMYGEESPALSELASSLQKIERALLDTAGKVTDSELARMLYQFAADYACWRQELVPDLGQRLGLAAANDRRASVQTLCSGWRVPLEIGDSYSLLWEIERTLTDLLDLHDRFRNSPAGQVQEPLLERQHRGIETGLLTLQRMRQQYDPYHPMISLDLHAPAAHLAQQFDRPRKPR